MKKNIPEIREREGNEKIHSHNSGMGIRGSHSWEWTGKGNPAHPCYFHCLLLWLQAKVPALLIKKEWLLKICIIQIQNILLWYRKVFPVMVLLWLFFFIWFFSFYDQFSFFDNFSFAELWHPGHRRGLPRRTEKEENQFLQVLSKERRKAQRHKRPDW